MKTKKLALMGILTSLALIIFVVEAQLPPIGFAGVKLGLANIITLFAICMIGKREAGAILLIRIILGSIYCGTMTAFIFSLVGGTLAYITMIIAYSLLGKDKLWVVSVFGAIAHNIGQLCAAVVVMQTPSLVVYLPVLIISAIITGVFIGILSQAVVNSPVNKHINKK